MKMVVKMTAGIVAVFVAYLVIQSVVGFVVGLLMSLFLLILMIALVVGVVSLSRRGAPLGSVRGSKHLEKRESVAALERGDRVIPSAAFPGPMDLAFSLGEVEKTRRGKVFVRFDDDPATLHELPAEAVRRLP